KVSSKYFDSPNPTVISETFSLEAGRFSSALIGLVGALGLAGTVAASSAEFTLVLAARSPSRADIIGSITRTASRLRSSTPAASGSFDGSADSCGVVSPLAGLQLTPRSGQVSQPQPNSA